MTFREKLMLAAEDDPAFATSVKRLYWASFVFGTALIAALVIGLWALFIGFGNSTSITKIEKSACAQVAEHPETVPVDVERECEHIRQTVSRRESIIGSCIAHQRATGDKGANCPRFFVPRSGARSSAVHRSTSAETPPSGQAPQHAAPAAPQGGVSPHPTHVAPTPPSAPPAPSPAPTPALEETPAVEVEAGPVSVPTPSVPKQPIREVVAPGLEIACSVNALGVHVCVKP